MPFNEYVQSALSLFGLLLFFSSFKMINLVVCKKASMSPLFSHTDENTHQVIEAHRRPPVSRHHSVASFACADWRFIERYEHSC